jgi:hypothetical protein
VWYAEAIAEQLLRKLSNLSAACFVCACCRAGGRAACSFTEGRDVWYAEAIAEQWLRKH